MTLAGHCKICQQNVFLDDSWGCVNGHDWTQIEGWYDADTGQPFVPEWAVQVTQDPPPPVSTPVPQAVPAPEPEPVPEPEPPVDPVEAMRGVLMDRLAAINLTIANDDGVLSVSRGDDYSAAIAVQESGEILLWERLVTGVDPGARDLVRAVASEGGWRVRVALRRENVMG
ncbi:MAG: hypothetical protein PF636_11560 [Actinomycetota bacterium]|jgi:hypothetical protein|nr:hypothetical protein [Actinomycetota bacterium]